MGINLRYSPLEWDEATKSFTMGVATTGLNQSGVMTTGILQSGAMTTGISQTGVMTTGISINNATTGINIGASTTGILIGGGAVTTGISVTATSLTDGIKISGTTPVDGIEVSSACSTNGLHFSGANATAIDVSVIQAVGTGWSNAAVFQHGTYGAAGLAYGTQTDHLLLKSMHITAGATGKYVMGDVCVIDTSATSTGYFVGNYNYITVNHTVGAAIANYAEIDVTATAALNGNVQCYYAELNVDAGTITGAGKLSGMTVEVDVEVGVTIAQEVIGIEVDMRGIKVDVVGRTAGIKVTKAGGSNYLDHGLLFSNEFSNTTSVIEMDLSQGNTPVGIRFNAGAAGHVITSALQFVSTTGGTTYFADFDGAADGLPFTKTATDLNTTCSGLISVLDQDGAIGYINVWTG